MPTFRHRAALIGARILLSAASSWTQSAAALSARPQPDAAVADASSDATRIRAKIGSPIASLEPDLTANIR